MGLSGTEAVDRAGEADLDVVLPMRLAELAGEGSVGRAAPTHYSIMGLVETATEPDAYLELPFEWPESPAQARNASTGHPPPPIVELLRRKPWLLAALYRGEIPRDAD